MPYKNPEDEKERRRQPDVKDRQRDHAKKHYQNNRQKIIDRAKVGKKKATAISQAYILKYLRQNPCVDCGESDPIVLEFDHKDPSEKLFNLGSGSTRYRGLKSIKAEIEKCEIRCANCHRRKTYRDRDFKGKG